jgi:hypothetical protein
VTFFLDQDEVLQHAERLVATHPLRTLDAIHVASAELFADRLATSGLTFVSADALDTIGIGAELIRSLTVVVLGTRIASAFQAHL